MKSTDVKYYKRYPWTHISVGRWSKTRLNLETLNLETLEPEDNPRVRLGESIASIFLTALGANITSFSPGVLSGFWAWTSLEVTPPRIMFQHLRTVDLELTSIGASGTTEKKYRCMKMLGEDLNEAPSLKVVNLRIQPQCKAWGLTSTDFLDLSARITKIKTFHTSWLRHD